MSVVNNFQYRIVNKRTKSVYINKDNNNNNKQKRTNYTNTPCTVNFIHSDVTVIVIKFTCYTILYCTTTATTN